MFIMMNWSNVMALFVVSQFHSVSAEDNNCFELFNKCNARYNCFAALINLKLFCHELLSGENGNGCTQICRDSIKLVDEDKYGKYFLTCNCDRDSECLTYQARASNCLHNRTNENKVGCATYSRHCKRDKTCNDIMEEFYLKCTHLISGTECTPACEIVQEKLYSHNITKGLLDCQCSGTVKEENFCRGVIAHTLHLCKTSPMVKKFKDIQDGVRRKGVGNKQNDSRNKLNGLQTGTSSAFRLRYGFDTVLILALITMRLFCEITIRLSLR